MSSKRPHSACCFYSLGKLDVPCFACTRTASSFVLAAVWRSLGGGFLEACCQTAATCNPARLNRKWTDTQWSIGGRKRGRLLGYHGNLIQGHDFFGSERWLAYARESPLSVNHFSSRFWRKAASPAFCNVVGILAKLLAGNCGRYSFVGVALGFCCGVPGACENTHRTRPGCLRSVVRVRARQGSSWWCSSSPSPQRIPRGSDAELRAR